MCACVSALVCLCVCGNISIIEILTYMCVYFVCMYIYFVGVGGLLCVCLCIVYVCTFGVRTLCVYSCMCVNSLCV